MSAGATAESWEQWTSRVATELTDLTEGEWLTVTATADGSTDATGTSGSPLPNAAGAPERERRWSLRRGSSTPSAGRAPVADVFLQARLLEGVLALECISDTEFEGLSDLTTEQEQALIALGWEQDGHAPAFSRTYTVDRESTAHPSTTTDPHLREHEDGAAGVETSEDPHATPEGLSTPAGAGAATEAARLLRHSLEQVLGALSPADVMLRRSATDA